MKLYEIAKEYSEVQALLESDDSENMQEAVSETMQLVEGEFNDKAQAIVSMTLNMGGNVDALDNEIKRLQEKKKAIENKIASVREYLKYNMEASGISKIECPLFRITLSKPSKQVLINDESLLPDDYVKVKTTISPDKAAIARAIKDGEDVPGASLVDGSPRLTIK